MIKSVFAACIGLALMGSTAFADDAPAASPKDILNLMLVTGAVVDFCKLTVDQAIQDKMVAKVQDLQKSLNMSDDDLIAAGKAATDTVAGEKPDCSPGSDIIKATNQMLDLVKSE